MKGFFIFIFLLFLPACDTIIGGPSGRSNDISGPSKLEKLISYSDIKSNYETMSGPDFKNYIQKVGVVEWSGKLSHTNQGEKKVEFYVGGNPDNLISLKTPSNNGPLMIEAVTNFGETLDFRAEITGFQNTNKFILLGDLLEIIDP